MKVKGVRPQSTRVSKASTFFFFKTSISAMHNGKYRIIDFSFTCRTPWWRRNEKSTDYSFASCGDSGHSSKRLDRQHSTAI
jgi:hypothetical protein